MECRLSVRYRLLSFHTASGQKISILLEEMLSQITQQQKGDGFPAMADSSREELVERMTSVSDNVHFLESFLA